MRFLTVVLSICCVVSLVHAQGYWEESEDTDDSWTTGDDPFLVEDPWGIYEEEKTTKRIAPGVREKEKEKAEEEEKKAEAEEEKAVEEEKVEEEPVIEKALIPAEEAPVPKVKEKVYYDGTFLSQPAKKNETVNPRHPFEPGKVTAGDRLRVVVPRGTVDVIKETESLPGISLQDKVDIDKGGLSFKEKIIKEKIIDKNLNTQWRR